MAWIDHALWWHVYLLGFTDAPIREGDTREGRGFAHLTSWLDYVQELGLNGLVLGPIFTSASHGYDTLDFFEIDPRLGTTEDFDAFLAACKERGIRVVLDGVFSHVSSRFAPLQDALAKGPESEHAPLFDIDWEADAGPAPRVWEGIGDLARLQHGSTEAREYVREVMQFWLARGIDGWRLDAAYSVPTDFWRAVLAPLRAEFPEAWFMGEVIHGDYPQFVAESGADTVTEYELWKAIYSSIENRNFFELEWTLRRHAEFAEAFLPYTFVGNHDTSRLASVLGAEGSLAAHALLLTLPGTPAIYYGDEQAFRGVKEERIGGDDDVRAAFPESPSPDPFFGEGAAMRDAMAALIALRRSNPWLVTATIEVEEVANERLVYRVSERASEPRTLRVRAEVLSGGEGSETPDSAEGIRARVRVENADGSLAWEQPNLA